MNTEKALFILRHGSYEGHQKYLEAVKVIEDEYNRQKETIEQLKTALFKCGEEAVEIANYKKIAEHQQSISMDRFFEIKRLKEELALAKKAVLALTEEQTAQRAEIEEQASLILSLSRIQTTVINEAKAEAVKEFAERLKENTREIMLYGEIVMAYHIDNLVKEFTEGGNT